MSTEDSLYRFFGFLAQRIIAEGAFVGEIFKDGTVETFGTIQRFKGNIEFLGFIFQGSISSSLNCQGGVSLLMEGTLSFNGEVLTEDSCVFFEVFHLAMGLHAVPDSMDTPYFLMEATEGLLAELQQLRSVLEKTDSGVWMGGKCKKLGAVALLEEFQREVGCEAAVVGGECMGKCKTAPNVNVLNCLVEGQDLGAQGSVRPGTNRLRIAVGLEDIFVTGYCVMEGTLFFLIEESLVFFEEFHCLPHGIVIEGYYERVGAVRKFRGTVCVYGFTFEGYIESSLMRGRPVWILGTLSFCGQVIDGQLSMNLTVAPRDGVLPAMRMLNFSDASSMWIFGGGIRYGVALYGRGAVMQLTFFGMLTRIINTNVEYLLKNNALGLPRDMRTRLHFYHIFGLSHEHGPMGTALQHLPAELWRNIFSRMDNNRQRWSVGLACQQFLGYLRDHKEFTYCDDRDWESLDEDIWRMIATPLSDDDLRALVKSSPYKIAYKLGVYWAMHAPFWEEGGGLGHGKVNVWSLC